MRAKGGVRGRVGDVRGKKRKESGEVAKKHIDKNLYYVYNIGGNRFWAYLIIRGDQYEESDTENQICFILAQVFLGGYLCFFDFLKN